jgi:MerR family transcriptional regulator/heat shock protein HspR
VSNEEDRPLSASEVDEPTPDEPRGEDLAVTDPEHERGVYGISVTAEMVGTGVQNLRLYERRGLLLPSRSAGGTRLYSAKDVGRLHRILGLLGKGLNLAGVAMVLELQDDNSRMRSEMTQGTDQDPRAAQDRSDGPHHASNPTETPRANPKSPKLKNK